MNAQQAQLRQLIAGFAPEDGDFDTAIDGLRLFRRSAPSEPVSLDYKPGLAFVAQGAKTVMLGNEKFRYGGNDYLLTSIGLPVMSQVVEASEQRPYLCFVVDIDMGQIVSLYNEIGAPPVAVDACERGMGVGQLTAPLLDASARLLSLLTTPQAIPVLAPLIRKEIAYHLLTGPQGAGLVQRAALESQTHRIGRALEWLRENFTQPLRIDELAARVNMSVSSLHHQFKALTAMTPLQYQKTLRLRDARKLMLIDMVDAGAAGHRVGYESASQFSREYARQYGLSPGRDIAQARLRLQPEGSGAGA
jgi:AraC-like DNA-binding protein